MPTEFLMPKLGLTMTEGTVVEWLVPEGGTVQAGTAALLVATDKVETEIEAPATGVLAPLVGVGDTIPCGEPIAWVLAPGETAPAGARAEAPAAVAVPAAAPAPQADAPQAPAPPVGGRLLASPNAKRMAKELGVDLARLTGSGPGGRIVSEDVEAAAAAPVTSVASAPPLLASYTVRRLAERLGLDPATVPPTGPGGRLTRDDVLAAARRSTAAAPAAVPVGERLTGVRGLIAERMVRSLQEMAQLTLTMDVDMDRAVELRRQLAEIGAEELGAVPTYTDMLVAAAARALRAHPVMNSRIADGAVEHLDAIHVGLAVATDRGLTVPVVRDADTLPLPDLAVRTAELAALAREHRLRLPDLEGATFSVTNLGMFGVDMFTPIVNPPNVAILGVGRLRDDTAWDGDTPRRVTRLTLSLTWDHRVADGAPAAEYCRAVKELLEQPLRLLA
ncbi:MAG: 2-oxo acid dehydrogenase subunit E2 [Acidimicrobiales bacterium]|nr:2-oxo acid dehydrogenase subunit E2 [Acidimicrobiales bacterium]